MSKATKLKTVELRFKTDFPKEIAETLLTIKLKDQQSDLVRVSIHLPLTETRIKSTKPFGGKYLWEWKGVGNALVRLFEAYKIRVEVICYCVYNEEAGIQVPLTQEHVKSLLDRLLPDVVEVMEKAGRGIEIKLTDIDNADPTWRQLYYPSEETVMR